MAELQLQRNDEAYNLVESVIQRIAGLLQFKYIPWLRQVNHGDDRPWSGHIYRTMPHAFGLFAVEDDVRLFCSTSMRLELFQEHVRETLGLDKDAFNNLPGGKILILHEQLAKLRLSFPNSLNLVLVLHRPDAGTSLRDEHKHNALFKASMASPIETQHSFLLYRREYLNLREWACRVGILSEECRLVSEELLVNEFTRVFFEQDFDSMSSESSLLPQLLKSDFFEFTRGQFTNPRFMQNSCGHEPLIPSQHSEAISRAVDTTTIPTPYLAAWTANALAAFILSYPVFVKIDARCWDLRLQGKLAQRRFVQRVRELVEEIQVKHDSISRDGLRLVIWPEMSADLDSLTFLLGLQCPSGVETTIKRPEIHHACCAVLDQCNAMEAASTIECNIMDQNALQELIRSDFDLHTIAYNLPELYSQHLDYSPLSSTLQTQEAMNVDSPLMDQLVMEEQHDDKLRTSHEVLNRLQWDPKYASNRYEVGYQDRFEEELLWKPLEQWTKDKQAEDFVPMHRIHQFRELGTGQVIWDREKRVDRT